MVPALLSVPVVLLALVGCARTAGAEPARGATAAGADATCPWGRLGDGRGALVRCLTEVEARRLMGPPQAELRPGAASPPPVTPRAAEPAPVSPVARAEGPVTVAQGSPGVAKAEPPPAAPPPAAPLPVQEPVTLEIGEPRADVGTLPEAVRSLAKATDRFRDCVQGNGGLTAPRAEVELQFLVRGRGRAEGVSVKRWKGVTEAAARCVASVVDRRYVGYPEEPIVGAAMVFKFSKKKQ